MKYEDLKILDELREKGSITEEEYQREKTKILDGTPPPPPTNSLPLEINENLYAVLMHLSQFISYIIIPLIMWIIGKDNSKNIDQHGKNIINFTISYFLYMLILIPLIIFLIGIPLLIILAILIPIFIIIATIKAVNGEAWKYPLSIEFIK
jgi:uncharacterized Tic20 family protein